MITVTNHALPVLSDRDGSTCMEGSTLSRSTILLGFFTRLLVGPSPPVLLKTFPCMSPHPLWAFVIFSCFAEHVREPLRTLALEIFLDLVIMLGLPRNILLQEYK